MGSIEQREGFREVVVLDQAVQLRYVMFTYFMVTMLLSELKTIFPPTMVIRTGIPLILCGLIV
ncbi:MAG: hypothetical protein ACOYOS_12135 [Syntrophales bacterium]